MNSEILIEFGWTASEHWGAADLHIASNHLPPLHHSSTLPHRKALPSEQNALYLHVCMLLILVLCLDSALWICE